MTLQNLELGNKYIAEIEELKREHALCVQYMEFVKNGEEKQAVMFEVSGAPFQCVYLSLPKAQILEQFEFLKNEFTEQIRAKEENFKNL